MRAILSKLELPELVSLMTKRFKAVDSFNSEALGQVS